jgi:serine/threonine-protein phosphatase 6 regulatory ankyrin repeat subunit B
MACKVFHTLPDAPSYCPSCRFRWVFCQLERLRRCLPSRLRQFLNALPKSLDETYERILKGIPEENRSHVQRMLQCLAVAIRPLRVGELAGILTFDFDVTEGEVPMFNADWQSKDQEQEVLSACPSLITIVDSYGSRIVQFSHFSVKEFLTSNRLATSSEDISSYHIHPEAAHTTLAQASLGVLLLLHDHVDIWSAGGISFADYAAEYWVSHAQVGSVSLRVMHTTRALFDLDKPHFATWVRACDIDRLPYGHQDKSWSGNHPAKPLYYAALCGFSDLVEYLVKKHSQHANDFGGTDDYPLVAALRRGHIQVAEFLLQHGAHVDVQGTREQTPLHRAIESPDGLAVSAVQFLLKHCADVKVRREDLSTPLHLAVVRRNVEVARMLLERGVEVNSRNVAGKTALHLVPESYFSRRHGNPAIRADLVLLLLRYGAEVNSRDAEGATVLHYVSDSQDLEVARVLLNHGANVNAEDNRRRTPLHRVSKHAGDDARCSVAQLLVECDADVNARDEDHETPLHLASYSYYFSAPRANSVRMLLDHGANVNAEDSRGRTPLHKVFEGQRSRNETQSRFSVARLLVECGADVNARDEDHKTPLHLASYLPELESVRMLLNRGADVNAEDNWRRIPLHQVGYSDKEGIYPQVPHKDRLGVAQLLVERGADVNARDKDHETPLHLASYFPEFKLVRMLLDRGVNVNAEDNQGRTPLHKVFVDAHYAGSQEARFNVAQLLVERGADVNARDEDHKTPLHLASYYDYPELESVRMLLDNAANVNAEDNRRQTPLHQRLKCDCEDCIGVVRLLVERGADVNARDEVHETPLLLASYFPQHELVRMLLHYGASVDTEDDRGQTSLHRVSGTYDDFDYHFVVAQLLVERGADVNARDEDHQTPLHLASHTAKLDLVRMLLDHSTSVNAEDNQGRTPLHRALGNIDGEEDEGLYRYEPRVQVAKLLVEHGADVNSQDKDHETPLHSSIALGLEVVRMLLDHGANVNAEDNRGRSSLHRVPEAEDPFGVYYHGGDRCCIQVAQLLVERGADVNAQDEDHKSPLHLASYVPEPKLVRKLLDLGANVNAEDNQGQTPLHQAFQIEHKVYLSPEYRFSNARLLVECGADVNARDKDYRTPLQLASYFPDVKLVRMLLDHGMNINAEDNQGRTPLHQVLAAKDYSDKYKYHFGVVQLLVEHGADVNRLDNDHETPLHLASRLVSLKVAWILLKHGADLNVENKEGKIPFQLVQECLREEKPLPLASDYSIKQAEMRAWRVRRAQGVALMGLLYGHQVSTNLNAMFYQRHVLCQWSCSS